MPMPRESETPTLTRDWRFSFDDFVVGPSNELAYAASHSMCGSNPGADVLYLASPPGLGKTHLMQAAGKMLTECCNRKRPKVEYLTAEEFVSRFWLAIKGNDTDSFKARYRGADLLLLEDVHFMQGKTTMQSELLATLKALHDRGSKIIFTSSFCPKDLRQIDEQLHSRLTAGLFSFIDRPDEETRRRIFRSKASLHKLILPEDVEDLLAQHVNADVRQIESCLRNLILKARLYNSSITMQMAWEVIGNYISHSPCLSLEGIIEQVCKSFALTREQLFSSKRKQEFVAARNTAFYLARKHTDLSLEVIGRQFNRRHSTVIKGITSTEREICRQTSVGRQMANAIALIERNGTAL
jgi:chromosomal replication initiator protein